MMLRLFEGYPLFKFYGVMESLWGTDLGKAAVQVAKKDELIEVEEGNPDQYRLKARGLDFTISMINLDYSKKMHRFTIWIIILTVITTLFGFIQIMPIIGPHLPDFAQWILSHKNIS